MKERITMKDTGMTALMTMADGNPGAITALVDLIQCYEQIDPEAMMGGMGAILMLDSWGIYGSDIYILWSDKCNRDIRQFILLLRATQLGHFPHGRLIEMARDQTRQLELTTEEWEKLDAKVCEQLVDFQRP